MTVKPKRAAHRSRARLHRRGDRGHGAREFAPLALPRLQHPLPLHRELIDAAPTTLVVLPLRAEPTLAMKAVKGGIERALGQVKRMVTQAAKRLGNRIAVRGPAAHRGQEQQVQVPLQDFGFITS